MFFLLMRMYYHEYTTVTHLNEEIGLAEKILFGFILKSHIVTAPFTSIHLPHQRASNFHSFGKLKEISAL